MQDVGQQQFLMLLLVMQSDLDDRRDARERGIVRALDQRRDRGIDMRAVSGDLAARPGASAGRASGAHGAGRRRHNRS